MTAVKNHVTKRSAISNTQLLLWEEASPEPMTQTYDLPFAWADGDQSQEAVQRMLALVTGQAHSLYSYEEVNGRLVFWYAHVLETWVSDGIVWGRCIMTPEGSYVKEVLRGQRESVEEDD